MTETSLKWSESDQKAVREQLHRILRSGPFQQSRRRQRFLEYIVNETLAGRGERLKGYNIALEVFDRPETFDPLVDPVVRIEAARVRDRLREYYDADGQSDPISIGLPKGTYSPQIEFRQTTTSAPRAATGEGTVWNSVPELPNGPTIAVLPFVNLSGDPKQDYFSDGLTEDILTELSRARDLRVLARNTTFLYKGRAVDVSKLGRELQVRYVLEGSIRRTDDRLRVTAQLIDTRTGSHVWADRFDREIADMLVVQDEIVREITAKIAGGYGVIENTEASSATRKSPEEIQAYDLVLRARDTMRWDWSHANFRSASALLREAVALDPLNARARREFAWLGVIGRAFRLDHAPMPPDEIAAQAAKAVRLDPADARARMVAASAFFLNKQLDLFEHEAEQAMALGSYDAEILAALGYMFAISGQWQRGVELVRKAHALNAHSSAGWYHVTLYFDYYMKGEYERALEMIRRDPGGQSAYLNVVYIPICGQLGRKQEALENWHKLLEADRDWSAESFENWYRLRNMRDEDIAKLLDGVRKSGVLGVEIPG